MSSRDSERSVELQELLRSLRPRILDMLRIYRVPEEAAGEIVHDTFIALAVRWNRVGNRKAWLLGTLEARCRALGGAPEARPGDPPEGPPDDPTESSSGGGGGAGPRGVT